VLSKHLEGMEMAACEKFAFCLEESIIIIIVSWLCVLFRVFLVFMYVLYLYSNGGLLNLPFGC
jgi:hypothetical protein